MKQALSVSFLDLFFPHKIINRVTVEKKKKRQRIALVIEWHWWRWLSRNLCTAADVWWEQFKVEPCAHSILRGIRVTSGHLDTTQHPSRLCFSVAVRKMSFRQKQLLCYWILIKRPFCNIDAKTSWRWQKQYVISPETLLKTSWCVKFDTSMILVILHNLNLLS